MNCKLESVLPLIIGLAVTASLLTGCRSRDNSARDEPSSNYQSLQVGSNAPTLTNATWHTALDRQLTVYSAENIYVLVFAATWAPQCTETFSHLVDLQQQLAGRETQCLLITSESPLEVDAFLTSSSLAAIDIGDSNAITNRNILKELPIVIDTDQSLTKSFVEASGTEGIPTAFIVGKSGQIEWIGHPRAIDAPLLAIVEGRWNRDIPTQSNSSHSNSPQIMLEISGEIKKILAEASRTSPDHSLALLTALAQESKGLPAKKLIARAKFDLAIKANSEQLAQTFEEIAEWESNNAQALNDLTWTLYEHFEATKKWNTDLLRSAIRYAERAVSLSPNDGAILDTLAHLLYLDGKLERALEIQTRASKNAGPFKEVIDSFLKRLQSESNSEIH